MRFTIALVLVFGLVLPAAAQRDPRGDAPRSASSANEVAQPHERAEDDDVSLETATPDPSPRVPRLLQRDPRTARVDVIEQAGVGGPVAYGSAGVLEVGGTGAIHATNDAVGLRFAPFVGWFPFDGIELTYMNELYGASIQGERRFGTLVLIEPSGHLRLTDRLLAFIGLGAGYMYNSRDHGFALKPRAGFDVLVGRSGIFRPAFYFLWGTKPVLPPVAGVPAHRWGYGMEISYAAMF